MHHSLGKTVPCLLCSAMLFSPRLQHGALQSNAEHAGLGPIMMGQGINEAKINSFFLIHPAARQTVTSVLGVFHSRVIRKLPECKPQLHLYVFLWDLEVVLNHVGRSLGAKCRKRRSMQVYSHCCHSRFLQQYLS